MDLMNCFESQTCLGTEDLNLFTIFFYFGENGIKGSDSSTSLWIHEENHSFNNWFSWGFLDLPGLTLLDYAQLNA